MITTKQVLPTYLPEDFQNMPSLMKPLLKAFVGGHFKEAPKNPQDDDGLCSICSTEVSLNVFEKVLVGIIGEWICSSVSLSLLFVRALLKEDLCTMNDHPLEKTGQKQWKREGTIKREGKRQSSGCTR